MTAGKPLGRTPAPDLDLLSALRRKKNCNGRRAQHRLLIVAPSVVGPKCQDLSGDLVTCSEMCSKLGAPNFRVHQGTRNKLRSSGKGAFQ